MAQHRERAEGEDEALTANPVPEIAPVTAPPSTTTVTRPTAKRSASLGSYQAPSLTQTPAVAGCIVSETTSIQPVTTAGPSTPLRNDPENSSMTFSAS